VEAEDWGSTWVIIGLVIALAASLTRGWRRDVGWSKWAVLGLLIALVGSNVAWVFSAFDDAVFWSYQNDEHNHEAAALAQSLALVRFAKGQRLRSQMIAAALAALPPEQRSFLPFEKGDLTVVGELGLRFDSEGTLIDVETANGPVEDADVVNQPR